MPKYYNDGDSIFGTKIYCVFEKSKKPTLVSTRGRHNAQSTTIEGNPAIATIVKTLKFVSKK